jgi:hypothetical protein
MPALMPIILLRPIARLMLRTLRAGTGAARGRARSRSTGGADGGDRYERWEDAEKFFLPEFEEEPEAIDEAVTNDEPAIC